MPSRTHAKALLHDLFYEATDDGIEALEAVLAACRDEVLNRLPTDANAMTVEEMATERARIQSELDTRTTQNRAS
jgi:hypothetical protein